MNVLNPDNLTFQQGGNGFLRLKLKDGTQYEMVECMPLFPLSNPNEFISVSVRKDTGTEEIGIIIKLKALSKEQRTLVKHEIEFRYFSPEILNIEKITSKYGVDQWDVKTDKGKKTFLVQDVKENVIIRESGLIVITDIDKCKYQVSDFRELPAKAKQELEQTIL